MAGVRDPIPVRVLETGEHYPSIKAAIAAVTGRKPHGRHKENYLTGRAINGLHIIPEGADPADWVTPEPGPGPGRPRPVYCVDIQTTYSSISSAARQLGVSPAALYQSVTNGTRRGGYVWRWA